METEPTTRRLVQASFSGRNVAETFPTLPGEGFLIEMSGRANNIRTALASGRIITDEEWNWVRQQQLSGRNPFPEPGVKIDRVGVREPDGRFGMVWAPKN